MRARRLVSHGSFDVDFGARTDNISLQTGVTSFQTGVRIMTPACGAGGPGFKSQRARHKKSSKEKRV